MLAEIGAGEVPQLLVCNKIDRVRGSSSPESSATSMVGFRRVFVSARTGAGLRGAARRASPSSRESARRRAAQPRRPTAPTATQLDSMSLERPQLGPRFPRAARPRRRQPGPARPRRALAQLQPPARRSCSAAGARGGDEPPRGGRRRARPRRRRRPADRAGPRSSGSRAASTSSTKASAAWCSPSASYSQTTDPGPALAPAVADPVARDRQPRRRCARSRSATATTCAPRCSRNR